MIFSYAAAFQSPALAGAAVQSCDVREDAIQPPDALGASCHISGVPASVVHISAVPASGSHFSIALAANETAADIDDPLSWTRVTVATPPADDETEASV
jgi:hypothetical protein